MEPTEQDDAAAAVNFDLTDKVIVVTGGSRGLGRSMCVAFAEHGADVVVASRKGDACDALAATIRQRSGRRAIGVACHVGRWDDAQQLLDTTLAEFGHIDVLVNNAGMAPLYPSPSGASEDLFDKTVGVNLKGPFRLMALIGAHMVERGRGSIINVSSVASQKPGPNELIYGAAKAGLDNLTLGFARTLAPAVRVNTIMPGPFLTDISHAWDLGSFHERAKAIIPLQRGAQPHEIVGAALYLASDASSFTTGAILRVDGGLGL